MAKIPAFAELGRSAKDVLVGGKEGVYQFNTLVSASSKTSDGVEVALKAVNRDNVLESDLKSIYVSGKFSLITTLSQATGKLGLAASYKEAAPGLTLSLNGSVPDLQSGKLAASYNIPHVTINGSTTLTAAPKIDLAATTGTQNIVVGAETSYDSAKSAITKWTTAIGYQAEDYQVALWANDKNDVTAAFAHRVLPDTSLAVEVSKNMSSQTTGLAAGMSRIMPSGALQKIKVEHTGVVSVLHEQELQPKTKISLSGQFNALDLSKPPKYGVGLDLKY